MLNKEFYKNNAFFSEFEPVIKDKDHLFFLICIEIFKKAGIDLNISSIRPYDNGINHDSFLIKTENKKQLMLKISFESDNQFLINESEFLKNNKEKGLIPELLGCGVVKVGDDIRFLIHEHDVGLEIYDLGLSFAVSNSRALFGCLSFIGSSSSSWSINDYAENIFSNLTSIRDSEVVRDKIASVYPKETLDILIEPIKKDFYSLVKSPIFKSDFFCHGNINPSNTTSAKSLFKFFDFSRCFMGNRFFDLCFFALNFKLDRVYFNRVAKEYCLFYSLDYEKEKNEIRECLKVASSLFLYDLITNLIIEQCLYLNSRQDKVVLLMSNYECSKWAFEQLPCFKSLSNKINNIYEGSAKGFN